jgi:hypothetical protein
MISIAQNRKKFSLSPVTRRRIMAMKSARSAARSSEPEAPPRGSEPELKPGGRVENLDGKGGSAKGVMRGSRARAGKNGKFRKVLEVPMEWD